jgi:hypothetical protein
MDAAELAVAALAEGDYYYRQRSGSREEMAWLWQGLFHPYYLHE